MPERLIYRVNGSAKSAKTYLTGNLYSCSTSFPPARSRAQPSRRRRRQGPQLDSFSDPHDIPGTPLPLGLRHLRRFRCTPNSAYNGVSPRTLPTLLQLPSMREIDVRIIDTDNLAPRDFDTAASTSGITHLRLSGPTYPRSP